VTVVEQRRNAPSVRVSGRGATEAERALGRGVDALRARQHAGGWWQGELETNVTMDAEDLMMRRFLGVLDDDTVARRARWLRSRQRSDGSWANFLGGPADPSTTAEAYVALRMAGDDPRAAHLRRAREVVLDHGGLDGTRVFTRIWLALFGLHPWDDVPAVPPELIFLPPWVPMNVYDFACWARQTIVPIAVLSALRPARDLGVAVPELHARGPAGREVAADRRPTGGWARAFTLVDRALHGYERLPAKPMRTAAIRACCDWILDRQEADGSWGGIQPPWVYSLMALNAAGFATDHAVLRRGLRGWDRFTVTEDGEDGPVRRVEACQSPVWDSALALIALGDAGVDPADPALQAGADWLQSEEVRVRGDWAVRRPGVAPGGWAFEFDNDGYPDIDDTAEVVLALRAAGRADAAAVDRGVDWVVGMQSSDGGWAAFDADNTRELAYELPFCDFGAVIDPPSADVTAHVVEMLAAVGQAAGEPARRGVRWLLAAQEPDGSWFGRWGANHVYGTGAAVPALVASGVPRQSEPVRRAVRWLRQHQNGDGGWGEDLRSYDDRGWVGRGESTASQTAWALLALEAAGEAGSEPVRRGVGWLVDHQRPDGTWDEPQFTGTGFPGYFYINYHLYRLVFPVSALARCLKGAT
jgi:squalene-hopene/tetraprenyl-beta-curcumene cyclase